MDENEQHPLFDAINNGDLATIRQLVANGTDISMRDFMGEPAIFAAVRAVDFAEDEEDRERCMEVIRGMIDLGADLNALCNEGGSILVGPIFGLRAELVEWLLEQGVNPNRGCSDSWETVCDIAIFDYEFEAWMARSRPPLNPPKALPDADAWLAWVDAEAERVGYLRPALPLLLRRYGALTSDEMAVKLGGRPDQGVRWVNDAWTLKEG